MTIPLGSMVESDELLTRAQVAALLCVSPSTVTRWADEGKLTCVRTLGGHRRYQRREIAEIMSRIRSEIDQRNRRLKEEPMEVIQVEIPKLYGDHHTTAVHQAVAQLPGIQQIWVTPANHQIRVSFDSDLVDADTIVDRLARAGYPIRNGQRDASDHHKDPKWAKLNLRMTQTYRSGA